MLGRNDRCVTLLNYSYSMLSGPCIPPLFPFFSVCEFFKIIPMKFWQKYPVYFEHDVRFEFHFGQLRVLILNYAVTVIASTQNNPTTQRDHESKLKNKTLFFHKYPHVKHFQFSSLTVELMLCKVSSLKSVFSCHSSGSKNWNEILLNSISIYYNTHGLKMMYKNVAQLKNWNRQDVIAYTLLIFYSIYFISHKKVQKKKVVNNYTHAAYYVN